MAVQFLAELIGTPLVEALRERRPRLAKKAEQALGWLRDVAEPPAGIELRSEDGSTYTGLVILERSKPVLMLAVRHLPSPASARPPIITPPPIQRPLYNPGYPDPEDPVWDRDRGLYGR